MSRKTYIADQIGAPEEVDFGGKVYFLAPADSVGVIAMFERFSIRTAYAAVETLKPDVTNPEENEDAEAWQRYYTERDHVRKRAHGGGFGFGNAGYIEASGTQNGYVELVYQSFRIHHPEMTRETVLAMFEDETTAAEVIEAFNTVNADPKVRTAKKAARKAKRDSRNAPPPVDSPDPSTTIDPTGTATLTPN